MDYQIKKISVITQLNKAMLQLIILFFCITAAWQLLSSVLNMEREKRNNALIPESISVSSNDESMIYRLITQEKKWQFAEQEEKAKYNFDWFFQEALKIKAPNPTTQEVKSYFQKISSLMNKYFIYERNTTLTEGLVNQAIDCDLRSFIFYDITQKIGLDTSIVYSPQHAFIVWKSRDQLDVIWETTEPGQGKAVGLTESLYDTAYDGITYRRTKENEVFYLYEFFLALRSLDEEKESLQTVRKKVLEMADAKPDWHFLQRVKAYYLYDDGKNKDKVFVKEAAEKLLELEPASSLANYILMEYFYSHKDTEKARDYFNGIKPKDQDFESRLLYANSQQSWYKRVMLKVDAYWYRSFWNITAFEKDNLGYWHRIFLGFILILWLAALYPSQKAAKSSKEKKYRLDASYIGAMQS